MSQFKLLMLSMLLIPKASYVFGEDPPVDPNAEPPVVPPVVKKVEKKAPEPKYTEEDLNNRTGNLRKSLETKLEREATNHKATQAERDTAQAELDTLRAEYTSKETRAAQELDSIKRKSAADLKAEREARETAEKNYEALLVDVELTKEEALVKPSIPGALSDAMRGKTKLVDELNAEGKKTGKKVVRLEFDDIDKEGKPIKSQFPVGDAFKRMKEIPAKYGIYFEGVGAGGVGGGNGKGTGAATPPGELPKDIENYAAVRNAQKQNKK